MSEEPIIVTLEPMKDTPKRLIFDLCNYLEQLYKSYFVSNPFGSMSKQEMVAELTAIINQGNSDWLIDIMSETAVMFEIPTPDIFLNRAAALQEQQDQSLIYQLETSIVDKDSGYITAHLPVNGELKSRGILLSGDMELCRHLFQRLTDGSITAQQVRDLECYQKEHRILLCVEDLYPRNQRKPQTARHREYAR